MSSTDSIKTYALLESTWGTLASGNFKQIGFITEEIGGFREQSESRQVTGKAMVTKHIEVDRGARGSWSSHLVYGNFDEFVPTLYRNDWTTKSTVIGSNTDVSFTTSGAQVNLDAGTWDNTPAVGKWIKIKGATNSGNNGVGKVSAATSNSITLAEWSGTFTTESAGASVSIVIGDDIVNGTTDKSVSYVRDYTDLSSNIAQILGVVFHSMRLGVNRDARALIEVAMQCQAKDETSETSVSLGTTTEPAAGKTPMSASLTNQTAFIDGAKFGLRSFDIDSSIVATPDADIGSEGRESITRGTFRTNGSIRAVYDANSKLEHDKFLAGTELALALALTSAEGDWYIFDYPTAKFTEASRAGGQIDQPTFFNAQFGVSEDTSESIAARLVRFAAAD